ncbi:MAG: NADH-quinone oxidoreductase subunit N [Verrucomicrobia bacterium]|nr:NADH-quinone oxidoreductase subunit N [Verrucomicrobiota bacterium]
MNYGELFKQVVPETILVAAAFVVLLVDLAWMRLKPTSTRRTVAAMLGGLGCAAAFAWLLEVQAAGSFCEGILVVDPLTQMLKQVILILTVFTAVISAEADFTEHVGEFFALLLLATVAMMFLVSSEDLLMIFLSLEMTSLCLYVMTAFNKQNPQSAEAALKYFLFGGTAAAVMLFGLSLIYGLAHSTNLRAIAAALGGQRLEPLFYLALVMTVAGLGFKVAAVPFHLWAPDAYQGAPTPAAAFIASGSKVASFFVLGKLMLLGLSGTGGSGAWRAFAPGWVPLLAMLAVLSMVLGNLAAIVQKSVRRLLAYSAIAHAGYALTGLLAGQPEAMASLLYYVITYGLAVLGAFAVVGVVEGRAGDDGFAALAGLSRRAPVLALCLLVFILSLAGIPPLAGFFGKFYVFTAAVKSDPKNLGLLWLVIVAIAMSAVSLYYYLQVLKQVYVAEIPAGTNPLQVSRATQLAVGALALAVVALGCWPGALVEKLLGVIRQAGL